MLPRTRGGYGQTKGTGLPDHSPLPPPAPLPAATAAPPSLPRSLARSLTLSGEPGRARLGRSGSARPRSGSARPRGGPKALQPPVTARDAGSAAPAAQSHYLIAARRGLSPLTSDRRRGRQSPPAPSRLRPASLPRRAASLPLRVTSCAAPRGGARRAGAAGRGRPARTRQAARPGPVRCRRCRPPAVGRPEDELAVPPRQGRQLLRARRAAARPHQPAAAEAEADRVPARRPRLVSGRGRAGGGVSDVCPTPLWGPCETAPRQGVVCLYTHTQGCGVALSHAGEARLGPAALYRAWRR